MRLDDDLAEHMSMLVKTIADCGSVIHEMVDRLAECFLSGGKLLVCGNGGSAADAQHIAGEFVNKLTMERRPLAALALSTDSSVLTSIANDASYEEVYSRQVEALGRPADILVGLTTSGRSPNVIAALVVAREQGLLTFGFTGSTGGRHIGPLCDLLIAAASDDCARIQEAHEFLWHFLAGSVEERLFGRLRQPELKGA
jgi:D-sedoheptulose 7-phosphate isomerase